MEKQSGFEKIGKFLSRKLKGEELAAFQRKLENDADFADEVDLHRQMGKALKNSPEDDFRANLSVIGKRQSMAKRRIIGFWAIVFLLIGVGWWMISSDSEIDYMSDDYQESPLPKIESKDNSVIETKSTKVDVLENETIPEKTNKIDQVKEESPTPPTSRPIAANFETNSLLESHIGNAIRGGHYSFEINQPAVDERLVINKNESVFRFSGVLQTNKQTLNDDFQVHLFTNKKEDYENFRPVFTLPLSFEKINDAFAFDVVQKQKLPNGLYYYLLEDANSGEMIRVGKVLVTPKE